MQELDLALDILNEVVDKKTPFNEALRQVFQTNEALRPMRANVAGLVGCELRHHLLFAHLLRHLDVTEEEKRYVALCLSNQYFFRHFEKDAVTEALKEKLGEKYAALEELLKDKPEANSLIPESIPHASNLYLSLRYNFPEWVLKVFEHYGYGATYKTIKKLSRPFTSVLRVKTSEIAMEEVLKDPEFAALEGQKDLVEYHGKTSLKKNALYRAGKLFDVKPLAHDLLAKHMVQAPQQITLYNGNADCGLELDLLETYGKSVGMYLITPDTDKKIPVTKAIKEKDLKNVSFASSENAGDIASLISHPQDVIICAPKSTNFDDIPTSPDYLLHFDKDGMDGVIENELVTLNNLAQFVEVGGKLIYVIFTISKKEGHGNVVKFLQTHPEFTLVEEKQHFPFDGLGTAAYVALFQKGEKELPIAPKPYELPETSGEASSVSASAKE